MKKRIITALTMLLTITLALVLSGCDNFSLIELLNNDISLVPEEVTLNLNESINFEVSAGIAPFTFTEVGDGPFPNGVFTAPGTAGNYTIQVKDGRDRTSKAVITVVDPATQVSLTPAMVNTTIGGTVSYTISGGTGSYTVTLDPGLGGDNHPGDGSLQFDYTAGGVAGLDTITVTDSLGKTATANVTITNNTALMISPSIVELKLGKKVRFSASGGIPGYTFSQLSGGGTFNSSTRRYTAPSIMGGPTAVVSVHDTTTAAPVDAIIYIVENPFTINPSGKMTLHVGDQFTFSASYGVPPYNFSIYGNEPSGSINSTSGLFTALIKVKKVFVVAEDSRGTTSTCRVKIKK